MNEHISLAHVCVSYDESVTHVNDIHIQGGGYTRTSERRQRAAVRYPTVGERTHSLMYMYHMAYDVYVSYGI